MVRLSAVTWPWAALGGPCLPSALPMAITVSPTDSLEESPTLTVFNPDAPSICTRATSSAASVPITCALWLGPVPATRTAMLLAPSMTWLLVSTCPDAVITIPLPAATPSGKVEVMSTTAGSTCASIDGTSAEPPLGRAPADPGAAAGGGRTAVEGVGCEEPVILAPMTAPPTPLTRRSPIAIAAVRSRRRRRGGGAGSHGVGSHWPGGGGD